MTNEPSEQTKRLLAAFEDLESIGETVDNAGKDPLLLAIAGMVHSNALATSRLADAAERILTVLEGSWDLAYEQLKHEARHGRY